MKSVLIIGCGSIGERHLRCFQKTGRCSVTACDANHALLTAMQQLYGAPTFASLDVALAESKFDTAVVCTPAQHQMNHFQAPNETTLLIGCERGSIKIELHERRWGFLRHGDIAWTWHVSPPLERDDLFIAQAHAFLDGMDGKPAPLAAFEEAVQTLKFNQAALRSAATGAAIVIE